MYASGVCVECMWRVYGACGVYVCVYVVYKYGRSVCGVCVCDVSVCGICVCGVCGIRVCGTCICGVCGVYVCVEHVGVYVCVCYM